MSEETTETEELLEETLEEELEEAEESDLEELDGDQVEDDGELLQAIAPLMFGLSPGGGIRDRDRNI